jgi:tRNA(Ile)-lysidine synthase
MIEQYAYENDLVWREDSSNSSDDYTRNFIRHQIIPKLKEINPSLEETLARGKRKLVAELALTDVAFDKWKEKFVERRPQVISIRKNAFDGIAHGAMLLYRLLGEYDFNFTVCEEIVNALSSQSGTKFLSSSHSLVIDRDSLILAPQRISRSEVTIVEGQLEAHIDEWRMRIEKTSVALPTTNAFTAVLDKTKLQFPLVWRTWQPGDFFYPLGMEHRKKLSDFLVDVKVPLPEKERVTVLETKGEIIWVVGYRIDNRYKLTAETKEALAFTVTADFG